MKHLEQDGTSIVTVDQLRAVMEEQGIDSLGHIIWDHQRAFSPPWGTAVVTEVSGGYRLTIEERGSVAEIGVFPDQAALVQEYLRRTDLRPRRTPGENARAAATGKRASIEKAEYRAQVKAETARLIAEQDERRAQGGGDDQS